jgi:hypothetical protein
MNLDDKDRKLIILAMDPGVAPGERAAALDALFRRFGSKYGDGYELIKNIEAQSATAQLPTPSADIVQWMRQRAVAGGVVLRFGKYKGRALREIPIDYLFWLFTDCNWLNPSTRKAISIFIGTSP